MSDKGPLLTFSASADVSDPRQEPNLEVQLKPVRPHLNTASIGNYYCYSSMVRGVPIAQVLTAILYMDLIFKPTLRLKFVLQ